MDKITSLRKDIDVIDDQIMELLDKRFHLTTKIGEVKKLQKSEVLVQNREDIILNKTSKYSHSPELKVIYNTIMNESKKLQRK